MNASQNIRNESLIQPLQERACVDPDRRALVFLHDDGNEKTVSTFEFHRQACRYSELLQEMGLEKGDLIILVLRHSQDLLYAFWGSLYHGSIASIFPFLTEKLDPEIYKLRVRELVISSEAKAIITFPEFVEDLGNLVKGTKCSVISTHQLTDSKAIKPIYHNWQMDSADEIAFLQHSSGTTGLQKGVALTHRSVLNQINAYSKAIDLQTSDVIVSWLPLYHDMGLIAGFVMPLVTGTPLVLMSPFRWVKNPVILFEAITQMHGTLCWLPNFAFSHSARAIREQDLEKLDLSSMRLFINCSEPVYHHSHQVFFERFKKTGLRFESLSTCYAMAENTFAVTQQPPDIPYKVDWVNIGKLQKFRKAVPEAAEMDGAAPMVSCGIIISGTEIRVEDESGTILQDRQVGEIVLRSNCMLSGYYHRPDLTAEAIKDGWYYTGDMGYLADGELYITGRKKDLILVGGKNIYPQDLEAIANTLPGLVPGRNVAFGVFDPKLGSEMVVMVCEIENPITKDQERFELELLLRKMIVQQSEIALSDVRLVGERWLIKTSSGKISRSANREKYLQHFIDINVQEPHS